MKITKATFKKLVREGIERDNIYIKRISAFDGQIDGTRYLDGGFTKTQKRDFSENTLGVVGIWLVGGGRDYFEGYEDDQFAGIEVSNSCGHFIVAVKK